MEFLFPQGRTGAVRSILGAILLSAWAVAAAFGKAPEAGALRRLSTDLRQALAAAPDEVRLVTVLFSGEQPPAERSLMRRSALSRRVGAMRWLVGEARVADLPALAGGKGVLAIFSTETYRPFRAPTRRAAAERGDAPTRAERLLEQVRANRAESPAPTARASGVRGTIQAGELHRVEEAWARGFRGEGVVVGMVDSGVDFAHPDLQGRQARATLGPYAGWPFAYDAQSGANYVLRALAIDPGNYWDEVGSTYYARTRPIAKFSTNGVDCTGDLTVDESHEAIYTFIWRHTSKSGRYLYTVHPDIAIADVGRACAMGYEYPKRRPAAVLLSDEASSGVYDTVYVDLDYDRDFRDEKPMRKGDELGGSDPWGAARCQMQPDGVWDVSAGMLAWISDGAHVPPGLDALYPGQAATPAAGEIVAFIGDGSGHGTSGASAIVAQSVITDPRGLGPVNLLYAGAGEKNGPGGPVLRGMAPGAKIAAFQSGYDFPLDAWTLGALGLDGVAQTGDEIHISNNSWGDSLTRNDGWDELSRFANHLNRAVAPDLTFVAATGNGGPGYGTVAAPSGGSIVGIGASTSYGTSEDLGRIHPRQFTSGNIPAWSNRGTDGLGGPGVDLVATGAWALTAQPLNTTDLFAGAEPGQSAYQVFGGTSLAAPVASGALALVYQAFHASHGRYPTWSQARALLAAGASDLGYDVLSQGSGSADAGRSVAIATDATWRAEPARWLPGDWRGETHEAFPAVMAAGESRSATFTIVNPTSQPLTFSVAPRLLQRVHVTTLTVQMPAGSVPSQALPTWLLDITSEVEAWDPDMLLAKVIVPYAEFDPDAAQRPENYWEALLYDWTDLDGDGVLWNDADGNGVVTEPELDREPDSWAWEHARLNSGDNVATTVEVSAGRASLSRRHDGVFFGLRRNAYQTTGTQTLRIQFSYYKKTDWDWLSVDVAGGLSVPAEGSATFQAEFRVPSATRPGVYEGAIEIAEASGAKQVVPVVANVAARGATFPFGAASLGEAPAPTPYDNTRVQGHFDWDWRYESGDWRLFYFDVAEGAARPGEYAIVDTQWRRPQTDVDTWLYGPAADAYSRDDPAHFGPHGNELTGASAELYEGSGIFRFNTQTGGPREIVAAPLRAGLNTLLFHNVLYAGEDFSEPFVGRCYGLETSPFPVALEGTSGTWRQSFVSGADLPGGLLVRAAGFSRPSVRRGEPIEQDDPDRPSSSSWTEKLFLKNCARLEIETESAEAIDIDLFLYRDGGDGLFDAGDGDDMAIGESTDPQADERVKIVTPEDGAYWIAVHGWDVPEARALFDITIDAVQGSGLRIVGAPEGPIAAGQPVSFDVEWSAVGTDAREGLLFLGPAEAPLAIEVPVTIRLDSPGAHWALY